MRAFGLVAVLSLAALAAPAFAQDLEFELINSSSYNLNELYVSPASADTWGDDILGMDVMPAGTTGTVTITDGLETCAYDLRFVTDTGAEVTSTQDLCELGTFTLHD